ncbi:MAG: AAA family ATPase, partial [Candidatus Pacearchaeota archaeon]
MILKKINLNNIRSYENQEVEFPSGSTLLSGDIGSGKTSVLLGIEFGLFGLQPGQRGNSILRNGAKDGGVVLEFELDNKLVRIERKLKRGKSINQDYCSIEIDGEKQETSVTELKNMILELLSYPNEFSKKQNLLYKFTVYTPQEEMKQIILQDPETRINTLRHVFGIDKYKRILENTSVITVKLREEKRIKEALTAGIEQEKMNIIEKEEELETKHLNLESVEKELFLKQEKRKTIQEQKEEISFKIEEKNKLQQEIEKTKIMILNKKDSVSSNKRLIEQLKIQLEEFRGLVFDESKIQQIQKEINFLKKQKQELNEDNLQILSKINTSKSKMQENEKTKQNISHLEICPTCLQDVDPNYKANVFNKLDSDNSQNIINIKQLELEKLILVKKISSLEEEISSKEKNIQETNILKIRLQNLEEKRKRMQELEKSSEMFEKDIEILNQHFESLKYSIFELSKYDNLFEEKKKQLDEALNNEKQAEIKVA